jgi:hypothetical protein
MDGDRFDDVCKPVLSNTRATTDTLGVAVFPGFSYASGPPGLWNVEFTAGGVVGTDTTVDVSSSIALIVLDASRPPPANFTPGVPLTSQPRMQLLV